MVRGGFVGGCSKMGGGGGPNPAARGCPEGGPHQISKVNLGGVPGRASGGSATRASSKCGAGNPGRASGGSATRASSKCGAGNNCIEGGGDGQSPIFTGMRILLVGFAPRCRRELEQRITDKGGLVLSSADYELYTHVCVEGEVKNSDKRIITKEWIRLCCDSNMKLDASNVLCELDETKAATMSRKLRTESKARRVLYFEERDMVLHELFVCEADKSSKISMAEYLSKIKDPTIKDYTPAGFGHLSVTTHPDIKNIMGETYALIKSLHRAGFSLWGHFNIGNFAVDESRMNPCVRFADMPKSTLEEFEAEGKKLDLEEFVRMVKRHVLNREFQAHDMTLWLSMIGEADVEEILPYHTLLMDVRTSSDSFSVWYDMLLDLKDQRKGLYDDIIHNLEKKYDGWQDIIRSDEGNTLLLETLQKGAYGDTVDELLRLLRNSRQHSSRYWHAMFALIIGQNFPNLLSDFQKELYRAGCFRELLRKRRS